MDLKFHQLFTLYALGTILLPTTVGHIHPAYFDLVKVVLKIRTINWATLCYNFLVDGVRKFENGGKLFVVALFF